MLYIIGLGLSDEFDITVKGLEAIKTCDRVYLEAYTSILTVETSRLETFYGKKVIIADRDKVETEADEILKDADKVNVAFLVVGDPYGATTHTDLVVRARELSIPVTSIHNASIMNAIGACGLQLYNFGQTVSIVFFTETWRPDSFTLASTRILAKGCILYVSLSSILTLSYMCIDIKVKEQSIEKSCKVLLQKICYSS
ncbi:diphthine synthase [Entomophthora muscae]|uniref:Diphthine synthase n=1 Tax=Entomophthora muscae TaxID=34485 RepID=A0ACC2TMK1_9FUNG|nr:diphthine synthase [Entomophthora muscae]